MSTALMNCSLSLSTASFSLSPVLGHSNVYVRSDGSSIFGRPWSWVGVALVDGDLEPVSAPAILSLVFGLSPPPPHAVKSSAADAPTATVVSRRERRFTADS